MRASWVPRSDRSVSRGAPCYTALPVKVAVYVHFPWCLQRCPYCDFAPEALPPARIPHEAYARAVVRELALRVEALGAPVEPLSLFFGGGTPSLWEHDALGAVVRAV